MIIDKPTAMIEIIAAISPAFIDSSPRLGPMFFSSIILSGAGSAPDFKSIASSLACFSVKLPLISPLHLE